MAASSDDTPRMMFVKMTFFWEIVIIVCFSLFTKYDPSLTRTRVITSTDPRADAIGTYPMYQDVHVMIFVGFGFLMTFLKKYGFSAVSFNFVISALSVQWAMLCAGFWHAAWKDHWTLVELDITSLIAGDFAAGAVMITFGALLGKVSPLQMFFVMLLEVMFMTLNEAICVLDLYAADVGGSMFVHAFGAYFGLAVSWMMTRPPKDAEVAEKNGSDRHSDMFAMIGTLFLWMFWPSFNGALAGPTGQSRVVLNTVLSLSASCISAFYADALMRKRGGRFDMVSIQNATLAGGVAVGSCANMIIQPWGALCIGAVAGLLSVFGYVVIQPYLAKTIGLDDTCGVHNLHGMPGVMGAIAGIIVAAAADRDDYGAAIAEIWPGRAAVDMNATWPTEFAAHPELFAGVDPAYPAGEGWGAGAQAAQQLYALLVTLGVSIGGGLLTGYLLNLGGQFDEKKWYDDQHFMDMEGEEDIEGGNTHGHIAERDAITHQTSL